MKKNRLKNSITYMFLVLVLSMKVAGLHMLSHADDKDHAIHCTICDHVITHNLTPVILSDPQDFIVKNEEFVIQKEITKHYNFFSCRNIDSDQLFSRPPPFLL